MKAHRMIIATAFVAALLLPIAVQPAKADGAASTRNIILGAAALATGIIIESNVAHKNKVANTLVGYLPDGSPVYADGHVVMPDGQTYYPGNYGQQIACNGSSCTIYGGNGSAPYYGYNGSPYGNAYGYYSHRRVYADR